MKKKNKVNLEGKFDVKGILKSLDLIKNALKGQDVKDGFATKFKKDIERVEGSAQKLNKALQKGFKSTEDTSAFTAEIKGLVANFNRLVDGIKKTQIGLSDLEINDLNKQANLNGFNKNIEEANKKIEELRNKDILKSRISDIGGSKFNISKGTASELAKSLFDPSVYAVKLKEMLKSMPVSKEFSDLAKRLNIDIGTPEGVLKTKEEFERIKQLTSDIADIQNSGMAGWKNKAGKLIQQYERQNVGSLPSNVLSGGDLNSRLANLQLFANSFSGMENQLQAFQQIYNLPSIVTREVEEQERVIQRNRQSYQDMANTMTGDAHNRIVSSVDIATGSFNSLTREMITETSAANDHIVKMEQMDETFKAVGDRIKTFASLFTVYNIAKKEINDTWESIKKLDEGFASIAMVTSKSLEEMWGQYSEYAKMSKEYGASTTSVIESSALFYQQGLDTNEVMEVTAETMKLATLSGLGFQQTTDLMTGAVRGFKMEMTDAGRVTDVYSELAAKAAADVREISYAMSKTASIARESGMEFETTSAFLTQMIETTRESPENLGSAMKAIIARFQEVSKNPNLTVDSEGEAISINKIEDALKSARVELRSANGEFRDLDEVFIELSSKWDSLDIMTKRYIATISAGSRQQSRFLALLSDHDRLMQLVGAAYSSAGKATYQFDKYQDTLYFKINKLKTSWEEFKMNLPIKNVAGFSLDFLSDALAKVVKMSPAQMAAIAIFGIGFGKRLISDILEGIRSTAGGLRNVGFNLAENLKTGFKNNFNTADYTTIVQNMVQNMGSGLNFTPFATAFSRGISKSLKTSANRVNFIEMYISELNKKQTSISTMNAGIQQRFTNAFLPQGMSLQDGQLSQIFNGFSDAVLVDVNRANQALQNSPFKGTLNNFTSGTLREFRNLRTQFAGNANISSAITQQLNEAENAARLQGQRLNATLRAIGGSFGMALTGGIVSGLSGSDFSSVLKTVGISLITSVFMQMGGVVNALSAAMGTQAGVKFSEGFVAAGGPLALILTGITIVLSLATLGISNLIKEQEKSKETNKLLVDSYAKVKNIIEKYGETVKKVNNEVVAASDAADKQSELYGKVKELSKEYKELSGKIVLSAEENERLKELSIELSKIMPDIVNSYDEMGNPILKVGEAWDNILANAKEYTNELRKQEYFQKAQSDFLSLQIAEANKKKVEKAGGIYARTSGEGDIKGALFSQGIYSDNIEGLTKSMGLPSKGSAYEQSLEFSNLFTEGEQEEVTNEILSVIKENFVWAKDLNNFKDLKKAIEEAGTNKDERKRYNDIVSLISKTFSGYSPNGEDAKAQKDLLDEQLKNENNFITALETYVKEDDKFLDMSENLRLLLGSYAKSKDAFGSTLNEFKTSKSEYFDKEGFVLPNIDEGKVAEEWAKFQENELSNFANSYISVFGGLSGQQIALIDEIYKDITKRSLQGTTDLITNGNFSEEVRAALYEQFKDAFNNSNKKISELDNIIAENAAGKAFGENIKTIFKTLALETQDVFWDSLSSVQPNQQTAFLENLNNFINSVDLNEKSLGSLLSLDFSEGADDLFKNVAYVKGQLMSQFEDTSYVENLFNTYLRSAEKFYDMSVTNQGTLDGIIKESFKNTEKTTEEFSKTLKGAFEDVADKGYVTVKNLGDLASSQYAQFLEIDKATGKTYLNVEGILNLQSLELSTQSEKLKLIYRENLERLNTLGIITKEYAELKKVNDLFKQDIEKFELYQAEVIKNQAMTFVDKANEKRTESENAIKGEREALDKYNKAVSELPIKEKEKADAIKKSNKELEDAIKKLEEATNGSEKYKASLENIINLSKSLSSIEIEIENIKKAFDEATDTQDFIDITKGLENTYKKKATLLSAGIAIQEGSVKEILSILETNYKDFYSMKNGVLMIDEGYKTAKLNDELKKGFEELVEAYYSATEASDGYKKQLDEVTVATQELYEKTLSEYTSLQDTIIEIMKKNSEEEIANKKEKTDKLIDLDNKYLTSLEKAIEKERRLRKKEESYTSLVENERKMSLLSRDTSGLNLKEIQSLEKDLEKQRTEILDTEIDNFISSMKELVDLQKQTKDQELEYLSTLKDSTQWWNEVGTVLNTIGGDKSTFTQWFTSNDSSLGEMTEEQKQVYYKNVDDMWRTFSQYSAMSSLSLEKIQVSGEETAQALSELGIDLKVGSQIQSLAQIASDEMIKTANEAFITAKENLDNTITEQNLALEEVRKNIDDLAIDHKNKFDEMIKSTKELQDAQTEANKHSQAALLSLYSLSKNSVLDLTNYISTAITELGVADSSVNSIKDKVNSKNIEITNSPIGMGGITPYTPPAKISEEQDLNNILKLYEYALGEPKTNEQLFNNSKTNNSVNIAMNIGTVKTEKDFSSAIEGMKKQLTSAFSPAGKLVLIPK